MEFTFEGYEQLLELIKNSSCKTSFFCQDSKEERVCVIRHDIDYSVEKAWEMAKVEYDHYVKTTYFFMLGNEYYNLMAKKSIKLINEIIGWGHEIGLHFDVKKYGVNCNGNTIIKHITTERDILQRVLNKEVAAVSFHEPSKQLLDLELDIVCDGRRVVNTYSARFFHEFKYISDSCMIWHDDIEKAITEDNKSLQVLIHPFWYYKDSLERTTILRNFIKKAADERRDRIAECYPEAAVR